MKIEHKAAWCVEADIKYTFTVLLILQPQCVMVILYFKWQNFLVSCLSSELFNSVIARGIRASLWVFFPPCARASELWQQFFSSSLTTKLFGWFLSTQVDVKYEVVVFFKKKIHTWMNWSISGNLHFHRGHDLDRVRCCADGSDSTDRFALMLR